MKGCECDRQSAGGGVSVFCEIHGRLAGALAKVAERHTMCYCLVAFTVDDSSANPCFKETSAQNATRERRAALWQVSES